MRTTRTTRNQAMKPILSHVAFGLTINIVRGQTTANASLSFGDIPTRFLADASTTFDHEQCIDRILNYTSSDSSSDVLRSIFFFFVDGLSTPKTW